MADQKDTLPLDPFESMFNKQKREALNDYYKALKDGMDEVTAKQAYLNSLHEIEIKYLKENIGELEKEKNYYINKGGLLKNNLNILELEVQIGEKTAKLHEKELEFLKEQIKEGKTLTQQQEETLKTLEKQKAMLETIVAIQKKRNEAEKALGKNLLSDMERLGIGLRGLNESTLGSLTAKLYNGLSIFSNMVFTTNKLADSVSEVNKEAEKTKSIFASIKEYAAGITKSFGLAVVTLSDAILGRILKDINESLIDVIKSSLSDAAKFSQIAGSSNEEFFNLLNKQNDILQDTTRFSILQKDLRESAIELEKNNTLFNRMNSDAKASLASTLAYTAGFNVSLSSSAKLMDGMQRGFRNTTKEVDTNFSLMRRTALAAGIDINKMFSSAEANFSKFVGYGREQGLKMFLDLEKTAKATGVAVEELFAITANYDTFTGAADAAGSLNAVLGGDFVNSLELVNANEQERIMLIKQGIDAAGIDFNTTDRRMKQAIMSAAKISDMDKATKLLGASTHDLTMVLAEDAATQEQENEAKRNAADVARKYQSAIENITKSIMPAAQALGDFANWMTQSSAAVYGTIIALGLLGAAFTIFKIKYMSSMIEIAAATKAAGAGGIAGAVGEAAKETAEGAIRDVGKIGTIVADSGVSPTAGGGIAAFLTGLSTGLKTFANPQVLLGAGALALSLGLFGGALIGIGWAMNKYFKDGDFTSLLALGAAIGVFALGAAALGTLAVPIALGAAAISAIGVALAVVGAGMLVVTESLTKGSRAIETLVNLDLTGLEAKVGAIEAFMQPFNMLKEIPKDSLFSVKTVFESVGKIPEISEGKKAAVVEIIEAAAKYQVAVAKSDESSINKLIDVLSNRLNVNIAISDRTTGGVNANAALPIGTGRLS